MPSHAYGYKESEGKISRAERGIAVQMQLVSYQAFADRAAFERHQTSDHRGQQSI
jgi:hypothetical protein